MLLRIIICKNTLVTRKRDKSYSAQATLLIYLSTSVFRTVHAKSISAHQDLSLRISVVHGQPSCQILGFTCLVMYISNFAPYKSHNISILGNIQCV